MRFLSEYESFQKEEVSVFGGQWAIIRTKATMTFCWPKRRSLTPERSGSNSEYTVISFAVSLLVVYSRVMLPFSFNTSTLLPSFQIITKCNNVLN